MTKYNATYQSRYNFLKWCQYWLTEGSLIYHSSWKPNYPKYKLVEYNTEELVKKHSYNKYIHQNKEYHAMDTDGTHLFFDKKIPFKGEWKIVYCNNVDELFE